MKQKSANDRQEGGDHYREKIQHWDAVKYWYTPEQYEGYLLISSSKYLARYNKKDGRGGVRKSIHYLEKLLEFLKEQDEEAAFKLTNLAIGGVSFPNGGPYQINAQDAPTNLGAGMGEFKGVNPLNKVSEFPAPKSNEHYTYEGGTAVQDFYTCKTCRCYFIVPVGSFPEYYHSHCIATQIVK